MWAIACENIFHLHFAVNPISDTNRKDQIAGMESCWFLFHVRINRSIQIRSSGEKLHCDGSHHPKTYQQESPVQMPLSMQDVDQQTPPLQAIHRKKHL